MSESMLDGLDLIWQIVVAQQLDPPVSSSPAGSESIVERVDDPQTRKLTNVAGRFYFMLRRRK